MSAAGGGMSMYKKREDRKKSDVIVERDPQEPANADWRKAIVKPEPVPIVKTPTVKTPTSTPELGPVGSAYQTNFVKDPQVGNVLQYGEPYLFARMAGARSYVTGMLRDSTGKVLQIEQSVPGEDIIRMS